MKPTNNRCIVINGFGSVTDWYKAYMKMVQTTSHFRHILEQIQFYCIIGLIISENRSTSKEWFWTVGNPIIMNVYMIYF